MSLTDEVAELFCEAQAPLADRSRASRRPWFSSLRVFVKREIEDYNRRVRAVAEELERRTKRSEPRPPERPRKPKPQAPPPRPPCQRWTYVVPLLNTHGTHGQCWRCTRPFAREVLRQRLCEHHAKIRERNVAALRSLRRSSAA